MSIDKIGSINTTLYTDPRAVPKKQHPVPEKTENIPTDKAGKVNNVAKIKDPPFFPIGDTWSIFNE
ncbi:MAG: hypothetical protein NTX75_02375 [Proteobacteria bacterium]|nr:hypothetical protein [Pseudomonadota bacterium]